MITTDQMRAALEKSYKGNAGCNKYDFHKQFWVLVSDSHPWPKVYICAVCLAALVNEGADDGMVAVALEDAE